MTGTRPGRLVVAVVTAYHPGAGLQQVVADVVGQVERVVVVDDGSRSTGADEALGSCARLGAVVLRHDGNRGIAAALNTGIREALRSSPAPDAVLTLDQDSRMPRGYAAALLDARDAAAAAGLAVGLVAPEVVDGLPSQRTGTVAGLPVGRDPIQSGLLLPVDVVADVGPFDEALFIDGVDTDFALRCLDAGRLVVLAPGLTLGHRLGERHAVEAAGRPLVVRGRPLTVTRSAPFRYYYLARNRLVLLRRHGRRHPRWALDQAVGLAGHLVLVLALVPGRRERAAAVVHGIRDGVRGRGGPAPTR